MSKSCPDDDASRVEYQLHRQVGHLLRRASQRHTALFADRFATHHLTALQFAALMQLAQSGETSQNQLGRLTAMDPNTIAGVVQRLVKRALVEGRPDPDDKRRVNLTLTQTGRELSATLVADGLKISDETLAPLGPEDQTAFLRLLRKLT